MRKPADRRQVVLIGLFFFLLSLLFTYPVWTRPNSVLNEVQDVALNTWILAWDAHALLHKPLELFNANMFFPHERTLAFSENMLGSAIAVAPLNWWGKPLLAYNVVLFASFLLSGVATTLWVRGISGSLLAGLVAGFVWAFAPVKFDHLVHLQLLTGQWIPFTLLAIARYFDSGRRRYAVAAGGFFGLQYLSGIYLGLMFLPFAAIYAGLLFLHRRATGQIVMDRRLLNDGLIAVTIASVLVIPISLPYLRASVAEGFQRDLRQSRGVTTQAYLSASWHNRAPHMRALTVTYNAAEANFFPGVVPAVLFIVGLLLLLPRACCQRWPGDSAAASGSGGARSPGRPRGPPPDSEAPAVTEEEPPPVARRLLWLALAASMLLGALHIAGFLVASWSTSPSAVDVVLDLCQRLHPSSWLVLTSGIAMALWLRYRPALPAAAAHYTILGFMLLISYLLAFGPRVVGWDADLGMGPYRVLYELAPYRSIRAVGRFGLLWTLFFAAMLGFGLEAWRESLRARAKIDAWRRIRVTLVVLLGAGLLYEYRVWPLSTVVVASPSSSPVDVWLAEQPQGTSIVHVPLVPGDFPAYVAGYLLRSTLHFQPLVNGYSGFFPASWNALAATDDLSEEFFDLLRSHFPVDYLIVHGDEYGGEFDSELAPRLLTHRDLDLVERLDDVLVFEVRRDRDTGTEVSRRFARAQLRAASSISFQAQIETPAPGRSPVLRVGWGDATPETLELDTSWRRFRLPVPAAGELDPDGTATLRFRAGYAMDASHPGAGIGSSARRLRADVLLDVQRRGVNLAINDVWRDSMNNFGIQAYHLGERGDRLVTRATFLAHDLQDDALVAFLDSVPDGGAVALGIRYPVSQQLSPAVAAALRQLGSSLQAGDSVRKYALIGARGIAPGAAAEQVGQSRAYALVGEAGHLRSVSLRGIRLRPDRQGG